MNIRARLLGIAIVIAAVLGAVSLVDVRAQEGPVTDQQIERIRSNCVQAKNTLNQLHASDALLRVNRGQIYESMSTKLMERFNNRASSNSFDNTSLVAVTVDYGVTLNNFRTVYIAYEKQLALALGIDCSKQPVAFYDAVAEARTKRNQVRAEVMNLNQHMDEYWAAVIQFEKNYQVAAKGGAQ